MPKIVKSSSPSVIVPPPPTPPKSTPAALIAASEPTGEHEIVPTPLSAAEALRELLASTPIDIATCAGMTPTKLKRYLRARHIAEAML